MNEDACQQELLDQSICMQSPDQAPCRVLRKRGLLPAPPPSLDELAGCYTTTDNLDGKVTPTTLCLQRDRIATFHGEWDEVLVKNWQRDDTPKLAIYTVATTDGASLWIAPEGHGRLRVAQDGWTAELARTRSIDVPDHVATVEAACKTLHDCELALAARHPAAPQSGEIDIGGEARVDPVTLRGCTRELEDLVRPAMFDTLPLPDACTIR
jgi:hypothetical protein